MVGMPCDCQLILDASPRYLSMVCTSSRLSSEYVPDLHTGPGTHESNECDMRGSQPPRQKAPTPQSPYTARVLAPFSPQCALAGRTRSSASGVAARSRRWYHDVSLTRRGSLFWPWLGETAGVGVPGAVRRGKGCTREISVVCVPLRRDGAVSASECEV